MKKVTEKKDRTYKLLVGSPLSYILNSRNTKRKPCLFFDEDKNINRALRYASNQSSPFQDEQDKNSIVEPIIFERGMLFVPKTNPVLQWFLDIVPSSGREFEEVDVERDAAKDVQKDDLRLDAEIAARELSIEQMETIGRVVLSLNIDKMTTSELKRDIRVYAKKNPEDFLDTLNDPMLKVFDLGSKALAARLLILKNNNKDIYFNLPSNKKKLLSIPFGETALETLSNFLQTNDGIELSSMLETKLKDE